MIKYAEHPWASEHAGHERKTLEQAENGVSNIETIYCTTVYVICIATKTIPVHLEKLQQFVLFIFYIVTLANENYFIHVFVYKKIKYF